MPAKPKLPLQAGGRTIGAFDIFIIQLHRPPLVPAGDDGKEQPSPNAGAAHRALSALCQVLMASNRFLYLD